MAQTRLTSTLRLARRARVDLERILRLLDENRKEPGAATGRERVRVPLLDREVEVRTLGRLVDGVVRAASGEGRRVALALLSGKRVQEVVDLVREPGPGHRSFLLEAEVQSARARGEFRAEVARIARAVVEDDTAPVVAFDARLLGALSGRDLDALDRIAKLLLMAAKGERGRMLWFDPPGPLSRWLAGLGAVRVRPSLAAWALRRSLPEGRFVLFVEEADSPVAVILDADGGRVDVRVDPAPVPPSVGPDASLGELARTVRQSLEASLVLAFSLRGRGWFLSTRSEVFDLPRLWKALSPAFPWGDELATAGWTLDHLAEILRGRISAGLERLRGRTALFELTDGEEFWTTIWDGRTLSEAPFHASVASKGDGAAPAAGPAGALEIPIDLPTLRWGLGLFLESGPSRIVSLVASRLPEGTLQPIDVDEALLVLDLEGPSGEPERVLTSGGTFRYLYRHWQGDAHQVRVAGPAGGVLERRALPATPLSIERRPGGAAVRLPPEWRLDPEKPGEEIWIFQAVAEASFDCGLAAFVSRSSELDRLAPGLRSRLILCRVEPPVPFFPVGNEVRRILGAAGLVRTGHGLAYAAILGTRRASFSVLFGPPDDPWAIHFNTAWPAIGEAAPDWLDAVTGRSERRGLVLGADGTAEPLEAAEFDFPLDPSGRMDGPPGLRVPSPLPFHLSVLDATSVPFDPSGVHLLRVRVFVEAGGRTGWGQLEVPYATRALRLDGPADRVLDASVVRDPSEGVRVRVAERDVLTLSGPQFTLHAQRTKGRLTEVATDWWRRTLGRKQER